MTAGRTPMTAACHRGTPTSDGREGRDSMTEAEQDDARARAGRSTSDGPVHYVDFGGPDGRPDGRPRARPGRLAPELGPLRAAAARRTPACWRSTCPASAAASPATGGRRCTANVAGPRTGSCAEVAGDAGRAGRQLDGRDDLDPADRRSAPETVTGLVLLDPPSPGPRRALDPLVAVTFAALRDPGASGSGSCWLRRTRQTPLRRVREMLRLCGVDPDDAAVGGHRPVGRR